MKKLFGVSVTLKSIMATNSCNTTPTPPLVGIGGRHLFRTRSPSESTEPDKSFYNSTNAATCCISYR